MPKNSIDDVEDVMEMAEIFKLLKIKYDRKHMNLEKMKKQATEVLNDQSSGSGGYSKGTTVSYINCFVSCLTYMARHNS